MPPGNAPSLDRAPLPEVDPPASRLDEHCRATLVFTIQQDSGVPGPLHPYGPITAPVAQVRGSGVARLALTFWGDLAVGDALVHGDLCTSALIDIDSNCQATMRRVWPPRGTPAVSRLLIDAMNVGPGDRTAIIARVDGDYDDDHAGSVESLSLVVLADDLHELWRYRFDERVSAATQVAFDGAGNVVVLTQRRSAPSEPDRVGLLASLPDAGNPPEVTGIVGNAHEDLAAWVFLFGRDGAPLWRRRVASNSYAQLVAFADGALATSSLLEARGPILGPPANSIAVDKIDMQGDLLWRHTLAVDDLRVELDTTLASDLEGHVWVGQSVAAGSDAGAATFALRTTAYADDGSFWRQWQSSEPHALSTHAALAVDDQGNVLSKDDTETFARSLDASVSGPPSRIVITKRTADGRPRWRYTSSSESGAVSRGGLAIAHDGSVVFLSEDVGPLVGDTRKLSVVRLGP